MTATLSGTVSYLARIALPACHLRVQLLNIDSANNAEVTSLAYKDIYTKGEQPPLDWTIEYNPESIDPRSKYSVRATILIDDEPAWEQRDFPLYVLDGGKTQNIQIIMKATEKAHAEEDDANLGNLSGDVVYRERIALSPNARIKVELVDQSGANNAQEISIAEKSIQTSGAQPPIQFNLQYPKSSIDPRHKYALKSTIYVDGKPEWVQGEPVSVLEDGKTSGFHVWMVRSAPSPIEEPVNEEEPGADIGNITGDVVYRQRIALDPNSRVKVELQDLAPAGNVGAATVAEVAFNTAGAQVPLKFSLQYPKSSIDPRHKYSLKATIYSGDKVAWVQRDYPFPVLEGGKTEGVHLWMNPAEAPASQPAPPATYPGARQPIPATRTADAGATFASIGGSFFDTLTHAFNSVKESATPAVNQALQSLSQAGHIAAEDLGKAAASLQPLLNQAGTVAQRDFHLAQEKLQPYLMQATQATEAAVRKAGELGSSAMATLQSAAAPEQAQPRGAPRGFGGPNPGEMHTPEQDAYWKQKTEETKAKHLNGSDKLTGVVVSKEPSGVAFPQGTTLKVQLADCSLADAPMTTLASQMLSGDGSSTSIPFSLTYDKSQTEPHHDYRLSVRVEQPDGKLWGITDTAYMVIHRGHQNADGHELQVKCLQK
jgi:uncharacterized lipoprotein YbaY